MLHKVRLEAMDKFMKECGNATDYTATISEYFTIPELFALKQFMYKHTKKYLRVYATYWNYVRIIIIRK